MVSLMMYQLYRLTLKKENYWMWTLKTLALDGLNVKDSVWTGSF